MTTPPTRVVVVGDVALDVVAAHSGPIVHGGDSRARITVTTGGAGANTAAWLAWCGVDATLVARVGEDLAGRRAREELTAAGVRCAFTVDRANPTCCVVVLVDAAGQRSMLPDRGAGARAVLADLDPALLAEADHLHLSGYLLLDEGTADVGLAMLAAARSAGLTTSVDPQSAALITDPARFVEQLRGTDLLLPNLDELAALTGSRDPASAAALLDTVGAVAVSTGADGASWVGRGRCAAVPAAPGCLVDTTGAGDAFDAGVLAAWLAGADPEQSLRSGVRLGTLAVGRVGAQPPRSDPRRPATDPAGRPGLPVSPR
ncbi:carbohydrate kinase family protein [Actinophytocola xanthii]|uniref:Ribokinase n=1 Tax=Actinophytocola xanthii TaxID=1912961 RepID=A0A1Q8CRF9_9PSEU|nr:sugar kinase [Actinophytocola xanthii]OLF16904.1 ribokinase [Actinophytocola xanthii]